jgi:hypothetical protein
MYIIGSFFPADELKLIKTSYMEEMNYLWKLRIATGQSALSSCDSDQTYINCDKLVTWKWVLLALLPRYNTITARYNKWKSNNKSSQSVNLLLKNLKPELLRNEF